MSSKHFYTPLTPVSEKRWRQAQQWEKAFWDRQNIPSVWWKRLLRPLLVLVGLRSPLEQQVFDDRNHWWKEKFNNYKNIPDQFNNVCELGCGPYTNVRLIAQNCKIKYIFCSDPLARQYITYKYAWLAQAYRSGFVSVDFHPAEECPYKTNYFDLTIMINVLDHVSDPLECLQEAIRITAPSGYLLFGQDLTQDGYQRPSNPGHPFTFSHQQLERILKHACQTIFYNIVPHAEMMEPDMHYGALVFIGRKREDDNSSKV